MGFLCDKLPDKSEFFPQQRFLKTDIPQYLSDRRNIRRSQPREYYPVKITIPFIGRAQAGCFESVKYVNRIPGNPKSPHLETVEFGASRLGSAAPDHSRRR